MVSRQKGRRSGVAASEVQVLCGKDRRRKHGRVRLHSTLGYRSPIVYEHQHLEQATAA
jgi:hypothetical protein